MPTSLGPAEILVILVVALIVLGPKRLPEAGRQVGKAIAEVRRWTTDVTSEIKSAIDVEAPLKSTVVEPTVVSASPTAVDTDVPVPAAVVVEPVTVSGTETGVDTSGESPAADPDAPAAEPTVVAPAEPTASAAEPPVAAASAEPTVPAAAASETQAVESGSAQAPVASEAPTAEQPESPSGDPARL